MCLSLLHEETEFQEFDGIIKFDPKYFPNTWTDISASVSSLEDDNTLSQTMLVFYHDRGYIGASSRNFKGYYLSINATWVCAINA